MRTEFRRVPIRWMRVGAEIDRAVDHAASRNARMLDIDECSNRLGLPIAQHLLFGLDRRPDQLMTIEDRAPVLARAGRNRLIDESRHLAAVLAASAEVLE